MFYYNATKNKEFINFNIETGDYKSLRIDPLDNGDLNIKIHSIKLRGKNVLKSQIRF